MIYLAAPYGGKKENVLVVEKAIRNLIKCKDVYKIGEGIKVIRGPIVSPIHSFGFLYDDIPYLEGMDMCIGLLSRCSQIIFITGWEDSKGCQIEFGYATGSNMPIYFYDIHTGRLTSKA